MTSSFITQVSNEQRGGPSGCTPHSRWAPLVLVVVLSALPALALAQDEAADPAEAPTSRDTSDEAARPSEASTADEASSDDNEAPASDSAEERSTPENSDADAEASEAPEPPASVEDPAIEAPAGVAPTETAPPNLEGRTEREDGSSPDSVGAEEEEDDSAAEVLGAANPVASNTGKPWQVIGTFGVSLGSSTFSSVQRTQVGYNMSALGLYRLAKVLDGRLDGLVRIAADGTFADGFDTQLGATRPSEVFFRDIRLGLLGRGLYRWKETGLVFGASMTFDLPTSESAQNFGRIFRWTAGVNVADLISKVGPGNLLFTLGASFRKDVGEVNPTIESVTGDGRQIAVCRGTNRADGGDCFTDLAPLDFAFIWGGSLRYFLGNFNFGGGVTLFNNFFHDLSRSTVNGVAADPNLRTDDLDSSPNALDAPNHSLLMSASLDVSYVFNKYFNARLGLSSFQVPIRWQNGNSRGVVAPFFDSSARNTTNVFFNLTAMY